MRGANSEVLDHGVVRGGLSVNKVSVSVANSGDWLSANGSVVLLRECVVRGGISVMSLGRTMWRIRCFTVRCSNDWRMNMGNCMLRSLRNAVRGNRGFMRMGGLNLLVSLGCLVMNDMLNMSRVSVLRSFRCTVRSDRCFMRRFLGLIFALANEWSVVNSMNCRGMVHRLNVMNIMDDCLMVDRLDMVDILNVNNRLNMVNRSYMVDISNMHNRFDVILVRLRSALCLVMWAFVVRVEIAHTAIVIVHLEQKVAILDVGLAAHEERRVVLESPVVARVPLLVIKVIEIVSPAQREIFLRLIVIINFDEVVLCVPRHRNIIKEVTPGGPGGRPEVHHELRGHVEEVHVLGALRLAGQLAVNEPAHVVGSPLDGVGVPVGAGLETRGVVVILVAVPPDNVH